MEPRYVTAAEFHSTERPQVATVTVDHAAISTLVSDTVGGNAPIIVTPSTETAVIFVFGGYILSDCSGGAYSGFTGYSSLALFGGDGLPVTVTILPNSLLGFAGFSVGQIQPFYGVGSGDYDGELTIGAASSESGWPGAGDPVRLTAQNGGNVDFAAGNSANFIKVVVYYAEIEP